ncbi:MAG: DUF1566 domain-containing protein [Proteobacteria bacterium]|nr:DUF1566 domain-containing protein [Pseudomonadota bacterium]MBU1686486.1 DUF1566 domain-containing protein [Pseudomonadota bacterium]
MATKTSLIVFCLITLFPLTGCGGGGGDTLANTSTTISQTSTTIALTTTTQVPATTTTASPTTTTILNSSQGILLVDSGQTGDYTTVFGEDSDYTIRPPSYTITGDGTVIDNQTGRIWQQSDNGSYNWYQASGTENSLYNFGGATNICGNLTLGGRSDWHLPAPKELMSIVNFGTLSPAIDTTIFPGTSDTPYWTETQSDMNPANVWYVNFTDGTVDTQGKANAAKVRCVSDGN